jgi:hypothetical protein
MVLGTRANYEKVAQRLANVAQQSIKNDLKSRLFAMELEIKELKKIFLENKSQNDLEKTKTDGLEAIRTPDLRRAKARFVNVGI